jgi:hypothetical protein
MCDMPKLAPVIAFLVLLGIAIESRASTATVRFDAQQLFDKAVTENLRIAQDWSVVELETGELFEDDGPAAGHSYQQPENIELVTKANWIKKDLLIPNPEARAAYLVVLSEQPFEAVINNIPLKLGDNLSGRTGYKTYAIDPKILLLGRNEIVLRNSGKVTIARDDEFASGSVTRTRHPNRSARSIDGGKTWDYEHLGPGGKLDGEYGIRMFLDHYLPEGSLTMPVLDVGNLEANPVGPPVTEIGPVSIAVNCERGSGGRVKVRARSGSTYVPTQQSWSSWLDLAETGGPIERPRGRYFQISLALSTDDPLQTPKLKSVEVTAKPSRPADWTSSIRVQEANNESILRSSIPFKYEPLDHPRLKQLREHYKLDEVVRGATNELELMLRLGQWSCNYWDWPNHIGDVYPPWDALEILKPEPDGTPVGGFCQQFNLVFFQACESFGFSGRAISISQGRLQAKHPGGGHEIVELWSNEWKKWVYVDGALAWYIVDEKTGTPLSMLELRERQLQTLRGETPAAIRVVDATRTKNKQFGWKGLGPDPQNWYLELRMIPRSNFLQEKSPLPLNQGTAEWAWTGSYVWTDSEVPAGFLFGNRVTRRSNFEWTLNQAHYVLEAGEKTGELRVQLDTETPGFDAYLAEIDSGDKRPVPSVFTWTLHPGRNTLRVRPKNVAGREGIPSWISLDYANGTQRAGND